MQQQLDGVFAVSFLSYVCVSNTARENVYIFIDINALNGLCQH